jgi:hypothetical protein|tara:strand:- start:3337 stop:3825 length:489 start_codon:yes stop_codon:yes gene_type:complete
MATTVTTATLNVVVSEQITLNGVIRDSKATTSIASVGEVFNQITSITTSGTDIIQFASAKGAGVLSTASSGAGTVQYIRITNLDDTNYVDITLSDHITPGSAANLCSFRVTAGKSIMLGGVSFATEDDSDADNSIAASDTIANIRGIANSASCDIEVYIVSL